MQTGTHVLRFADSLDGFIAVRQIDAEGFTGQFSTTPGKEEYIQAVVRACIVDYETVVSPTANAQLAAGDPLATVHLDEELFDLCRDVNPELDLSHVSLPLNEPAKTPSPLDFERVRNLSKRLSSRVLGQEPAVNIVNRAMRRAATGLAAGRRPLASFLFAGSTGVGKTELAKALADELFGDDSFMIRLDGSEYALPHEAAKLIGSPPGYVGHEQGGQLTTRANQLGCGILLVDEVEKADPKMHHMLLQLLDEGRLTDSHGKVVDFSRFVIILTTNTGAREMESRRKAPGFGRGDGPLEDSLRTNTTLEALSDFFAPEFLNRIDHKIVFNEIDRTACRRIIATQLSELTDRCTAMGLTLTATPAVQERLLDTAWDPRWGAREIRRHIVTLLETPLSDHLLDEEIKTHHIEADVESDQIVLTAKNC